MLMRKFATTSALLIAAVGITAGAVNAAPTEDNGAINYKATSTNENVVIQTDAGSMVVDNGVFKIKAANGTTVAGTDLKFRVDDFEFPVTADIAGHTATLTPQFNEAHATYKPVALPYEDQAPWKTPYDREVAAFTRMKDTIATGATIGTLVGGLGGAAIGCVLGGGATAVLTGALATLFAGLPGAVLGCIAGMAVIGFLGTLLGQLFVTAPVAILAAAQYFTTVNQPFTPAPSK